jgi:hypothetical protein
MEMIMIRSGRYSDDIGMYAVRWTDGMLVPTECGAAGVKMLSYSQETLFTPVLLRSSYITIIELLRCDVSYVVLGDPIRSMWHNP